MATHAPKLNKGNTEIDFNKPITEVYDFIRGLSIYPAAWFKLDGKLTKVYQSDIDNENYSDQYKPGTILSDNKTYIKVACNDGFISIKQLQMAGKSKMKTKELLNGYNIQEVDITMN